MGKPVLTLPQAQKLIIAALSGDEEMVKKTLQDVDYYMKHSLSAYKSHRKARLRMLNDAVV
jgi:hypothetical protein